MISVIAVLVAVGVVAISIFMCCSSSSKSERTSQSSSSPENAATKRVNPDPHEALANSREIKGGSLSARAHELKVMLGLPEKNGQVTVAVDMVSLGGLDRFQTHHAEWFDIIRRESTTPVIRVWMRLLVLCASSASYFF